MTTQEQSKVRLSVDCTKEERKYIKILAANRGVTISEYLIALAKKEMPTQSRCALSHEPNDETLLAFEEAKRGNLESFGTVDEFWNSLGIRN